MALTAEMAERIIENQRASLLQNREEERCRLADPFAVGRWVTLQGLQREELNGCVGMIIQDMNENGRVGVRIESCGEVGAHVPFAEDELVKIVRCGAGGEGSRSA